MRVPAVILLCWLCAFTVPAAEPDAHDGGWWKQLPQGAQLLYIAGMSDGLQSATRIAGLRGDLGLDGYIELSNACLAGTTNGQIREGMTHFYSDFRNRSITTGDAFWLVAMQSKGASPEQIEQILQRLRRAAAGNR